MGCPKTGKSMPLHSTGKTLTDCLTGDIDQLTFKEVIRRQFSPDIDKGVITDTEFLQALLWLNFGFGEDTAHWPRHVLRLCRVVPKLHGCIAIGIRRALTNDKIAADIDDGYRDMRPAFAKQPCHTELAPDQTSSTGGL
jgi:hypothetical protein